ncbi:MAG TPA: 30S ribosomal protein S11 [Candidatus Paceibacterota bacterium]
MGKKHIILKTDEELIREREAVEAGVQRAVTAIKPIVKKLANAQVHILASYNNVIVSLTDEDGNVMAWSSSGTLGFRGSKKATPFAASRVAEAVAEKGKTLGVVSVSVFVKGIGSGRESAIRSLASHGLDIRAIQDVTPIPHNGPRPRKPRRV